MIYYKGSSAALHETNLHVQGMQERQRLVKELELVKDTRSHQQAAKARVKNVRVAAEAAAARGKARKDRKRSQANSRMREA